MPLVLRLICLIALVAWPAALPAAGQGPGPQRLSAVADADPLELARMVERMGDEAVLAELADNQPVVTRLAAIRATPWLRAPETALARLIDVAGGRDSYLAPAAARAALEICAGLTADDLVRREAAPADLFASRDRLHALSRRPGVRVDIARAAGFASAALAALEAAH